MFKRVNLLALILLPLASVAQEIKYQNLGRTAHSKKSKLGTLTCGLISKACQKGRAV